LARPVVHIQGIGIPDDLLGVAAAERTRLRHLIGNNGAVRQFALMRHDDLPVPMAAAGTAAAAHFLFQALQSPFQPHVAPSWFNACSSVRVGDLVSPCHDGQPDLDDLLRDFTAKGARFRLWIARHNSPVSHLLRLDQHHAASVLACSTAGSVANELLLQSCQAVVNPHCRILGLVQMF
jgi:hypothetical protein